MLGDVVFPRGQTEGECVLQFIQGYEVATCNARCDCFFMMGKFFDLEIEEGK